METDRDLVLEKHMNGYTYLDFNILFVVYVIPCCLLLKMCVCQKKMCVVKPVKLFRASVEIFLFVTLFPMTNTLFY